MPEDGRGSTVCYFPNPKIELLRYHDMCICRTVEIKKRSFCGIINYFMFQKTWQKEAKVSTLEAKVSGGATILGT